MKPQHTIYVKPEKINTVALFIHTIIFLFVISLATMKTVSSQDAVFSQFYANPLYLNPAFAGSEHCSRFALNYRNQPFPEFGKIATYSVSADRYFDVLSGGLGMSMMHDNQAGVISQTQVNAFYAYHTQLTRQWHVHFGMQAGYLHHGLETSGLVFPDQYRPDGSLGSTGENALFGMEGHDVDFSTGMLFYNDKFYFGGAVHHLMQPTPFISGSESLALKYTFHAGYGMYMKTGRWKEDVFFSPNLIVQMQSGFLRINAGAHLNIEPLMFGVWYRQSFQHPNTLIFQLGIKQVNYAIGYSYDYSLSGFSGSTGGAHELSVLLNLHCKERDTKYRILNCPAF